MRDVRIAIYAATWFSFQKNQHIHICRTQKVQMKRMVSISKTKHFFSQCFL